MKKDIKNDKNRIKIPDIVFKITLPAFPLLFIIDMSNNALIRKSNGENSG